MCKFASQTLKSISYRNIYLYFEMNVKFVKLMRYFPQFCVTRIMLFDVGGRLDTLVRLILASSYTEMET
jgi:hypothetical protein